jgi:hypothetical protein
MRSLPYPSFNLKIMKNIYISFFIFLVSFSAFSQATFTSGATAATLASNILGTEVTITNPVITRGTNAQVGTFSNGIAGAGLRINQGICLTTGSITETFSNNNSTTSSIAAAGGTYADVDLTGVDVDATRDVVVFEFDVTLSYTVSRLVVTYQFSSEEYPNWVGSIYNDSYGFFVSGGDLATTRNIALVPTSILPVSINRLNYGVRGCSNSGQPVQLGYSAYYINNGHDTTIGGGGNLVCTTNPGPFPVYTEANGLSNMITGVIDGLTPGMTYHFKIAIGDSSDQAYDSSVFIKRIDAVFDTDGDGVEDLIDIDDDNDGILDSVEIPNTDGDNDPLTNSIDTDGDGNFDHLDLDSDGDGIPDNVEGQTTVNYIAPTGVDTDNDGLDNAYETSGITPVNTDGTDNPDYKDTNSDNEDGNDTSEAGFTLSGLDADHDGLDNNYDTSSTYSDPAGTIDNPLSGDIILPDIDYDVFSGGDVDFRDATDSRLDTDGDGIYDIFDIDDDNDGITDVIENANCVSGLSLNENFGTGARTTTTFTNYTYEPNPIPTGSVNDGEYAILYDIQNSATWASCYWVNNADHTPSDTNGRMALFNASYNHSEEFYNRNNINVTANAIQSLSFWVLNVDRTDNCDHANNRILPNVKVIIRDNANTTTLAMFNTSGIPKNEQWHLFNFNFNPGANTQIRIILINNAPGGLGNDLAIDDISINVLCDSDNDGVIDSADLDSDNDGIYDLIESGQLSNGATDSNNNGMIDGVPASFGANGLYNGIENNDTDSATVNIATKDSDGDGIIDSQELDSDNDTCRDVTEAGLTDPNSDGILGNNPVTVNAFGMVTSASGYTIPLDGDGNGVLDFQQVSQILNGVTTHPSNQSIVEGTNTTFTVVPTISGSGTPIAVRWQVSTDGGATWNNVNNGVNYNGANTSTLSVIAATCNMNNNRYRARLTTPSYICDTDYNSNVATLTVSCLVNLGITKTDGNTIYQTGLNQSYTIVVSNTGPNPANGANVIDTAPVGTSISSWTATFSGGATGTASGTGNINQTVNIPNGGSITYTVVIAVSCSFSGNLTNTATVTAPSGTTDSNTANNTATDTDTQANVLVANITSTPSPICVNALGNFTAANAGTGATYAWNFGSGASPATSNVQNPTGISWSTSGTKTVTLTTTSSTGCTASTTASVVVNALPSCSITGTSGPVCVGSSNSFTAPAGMSIYSWSISGNGTISGSSSSQNVTVIADNTCNTSFTLNLTITNSNGCSSTCQTTVNVNDTTAPTITGTITTTNVEGCGVSAAPAAVTTVAALEALTGNPAISDNCTADASLVVTSTQTSTSTCPIVITRTYRVTDACGNFSTINHTINVDDNTNPTITGTITTTNVEGCGVSAAPAAVTTVAALEALTGNPAISDNCTADASLVVTSTQTSTSTCPIVITRTYRVTDACGNFSTINHTINVDDNTNPTITGIITTTNVEGCGVSAAPAAVTTVAALEALTGNPAISDNCTADASLVVTSTQTSTSTCPIVITRTYRITDACGNFSTINHTINVDDNTNPTITGTITTTNVEGCGVSAAPAAVTTVAALEALTGNPAISDNCTADASLVVTSTQTSTSTCPIVITRTYRVTDACGNFSTINHTINVDDNTNPTITGTITTTNVEGCGVSAAPAAVTTVAALEALTGNPAISDNCTADAGLVVTSTQTSTSTCPIVITRTYRVTDACGNFSTINHTINVDDTIAPSFSCPSNINQAADSGQNYATIVIAIPTVTEACGSYTLTNNYTGTSNASGQYPIGTTTVTYTATDTCGNIRTCNFTVTVGDTQAPTMTCPPTITIQCPSSIPAIYASYTEFVNAGGSAFDNDGIDQSSFALVSQTSDGNICPETISRIYTISDTNGNATTCTQQIIIDDNTNPTITGTITTTNVEGCGISAAPAAVTTVAALEALTGNPAISDNCTADASLVVTSTQTSTSTCPIVITRTYRVTDACGNFSTINHTINVDDTIAPLLSIPVNVTVECSAVPVVGTATATDNCDTSVTVTYDGETRTDGACADSYTLTRTWTATDNCSNTTTLSQFITVQDTTDPILTIPVNVTVECSAVPAVGTATATDNCDSSVTVTYDGEVRTDGACADSYTLTRTWTATDNCSNTTTLSQIITVQDTTDPILTIPVNVTVECSAVPVVGTATATDNCDTSVTVTYDGEVRTDGVCADSYTLTRTWTATDNCSNNTTLSQIITVQDTTDPILTIPVNVTVECSAVPVVGTATATDNCDTSVTVTYDGEVRTDGVCADSYTLTRTWTATDNCSNNTTLSQIITVQDTTDPILTIPVNVTVECSAVPAVGAATATDNCDSSVTVTYDGEVRTDGVCADSYTLTRTWTATDNCSNTTTLSQIITVQDTTDPILTIPVNVTVECSAVPAVGTATATDNCDTSVTVTYDGEVRTDGVCADSYTLTRTWTATDNCSNTTTLSQIITIQDTTDPILTIPVNVTVECSAVPAVGTATATDNCDTSVTVTYDGETRTDGACADSYTLTRTWTATDNCSNTTTLSQTITVQDTTDPILTIPVNVTVECSAVPAVGAATATDNCDSSVTVTYDGEVRTDGVCADSYTLTRTWTATDNCSNTTTLSQTITVHDTINPTASNPAQLVIDCIADIPNPNILVVIDETDNCTLNPIVAWVSDISDGNTNPETITRTYSITDNCGNSILVTQTIIALFDSINAPTGNSPQYFCTIDNATLNDIITISTQTGNIYWYDAITGGNLLPINTLLVDGTTYYASQSEGSCADRLPILAIVEDVYPAPIGINKQVFCLNDNPTLADVLVSSNPSTIWYDASIGGNTLSNSTLLVDGFVYYAAINNSSCADRFAITIQLLNDIPAPTGDSPQQFCATDTTLTFADIVVYNTTGFSNINWYNANNTTGSPIDPTTPLVAGTYYAFQGEGSCAVGLEVVVEMVTDIPAPTGDSPQQFCATDTTLTFADIVVYNTTGFSNINWYNANNTTGSPIDPTTPLVAGTYYAFQGEGSCAVGLEVVVEMVTDIPAPTGDSPQQFCATDTTLTFADIVVYNTTGFSNINWYNANNTTGSPIDPTTPLVAGTYYAFQGEGSCAVGLEVVVEMVTDIPAPTGDSPQQFCATDTTLTFADIVVYNTTGFSNINWYNANNTTGSPIDPTTPLVAGTYYAFQGEGSCAVGLEVVVEMVTDIPAPTGDSPQQFCATDTTLTFADIVVYNTTGFSNINWYNANNTTGSPIDPTTPLVAGTYYAFQGEGSCAVGLEVVVEMVTDIPAPTGDSPQQFCATDTTLTFADIVVYNTTGFSNINWYNANNTTGSPIDPTTPLVAGTYYAFQGEGSCAVGLEVVVEMVTDIPAPTGDSPQQFCATDTTLTFADIVVYNTTGFSNINWYNANNTTGSPIDPTTPLVAGTYYAFQGEGSCAVGLEVVVEMVTDIPAPTGDSPQQFCATDTTLTFADIVVYNTTGFSNINWYNANNTTGSPIDPTTPLVAGTYYAFQGEGSCAVGLEVVVEMVTDIPAPTGDSPQQFCATDTTLTFADIVVYNTTGFSNINWYNANNTTGSPIDPTTPLVAGTYYAFQGEGSCAVGLEVVVEMVTDIPAPTGDSPQQFCATDTTLTFADIVVYNTTGFSNINWYNANNTTGSPIDPTTPLVAGTYYAFQGEGSCAVGLEVVVEMVTDIPAPTGDSPQQFCATDTTLTFADIVVYNTTGFSNINWYNANNTTGSPIDPTTPLVAGTYYAFQGEGSCAVGLEVVVEMVTDIPAPTGDSPQQFCATDTTLTFADIVVYNTTGFSNINWYNANNTTGSPIDPTTPLVAGTYYAFQGEGSCAVGLEVVVEMVTDIPAPTGDSPQQFCATDTTLTFADIVVYNTTGFSNINWYNANNTTGSPIDPTTPLVAGTYYAFQGEGSCAVGLEVVVEMVTDIPAPTGDSPQQFCATDTTLTFADIVVYNTTGFSNINWYNANNTTGSPIDPTTPLVAGTYYAFQGEGSCAVGLEVVVEMVTDIPAPTGDSPQQFCATDTTLTFADIVVYNTTGFSNINWYNANNTTGSPIDPTTPLVAGTYYAFQGEGSCAVGLEVVVEMVTDIPAPTGDSPQQFCATDTTLTFADIVVYNTTGFSNINWYNANNTTGSPIDPTTPLVAGTYYAFQGEGSCAVGLEVVVEMVTDIPAPTGDSPQQFCATDTTLTFADIVVYNTTGFSNINWYNANNTTGSPIDPTTPLVAGTYYAFQGEGSCAVGLEVVVEMVTDIPAPTGDSPQQFCATDTTLTFADIVVYNTTGFSNINWYNANNTTGSPIDPTTPLVAGTYYAFQGEGSCAVGLEVVVEMVTDIPAPTGDSPQQFCATDTTLTFADIVVYNTTGFSNINWYNANNTTGSPIDPTTPLVAGTYYAFQGEGSCAVGLEVVVEMVTDIPAPTGDSPQQFCATDTTLTFADIVVYNTTGFSNINWYNANNTTGSPIDPTTPLVAGTYYAFQGEGSCAVGLEVVVEMVTDIPAPTGDSPQQFCATDTTLTFADIVVYNTTGFSNINWYNANNTTGSPIDPTTPLVAGTYYAFQGEGSCAVGLEVVVEMVTDIPAPTGDSPQQFCATDTTLTFADIVVYNTTGFSNINWYNANNTTGSPIDPTTPLVAGTYYAFQGEGSCAVGLEVVVEMVTDIPAPTGDSPQQFCATDTTLTFADIVVYNTTGFSNINWYNANNTTGSPIDPTTPLVAGTYYAFQGEGSCAVGLEVVVEMVTDIPAPTGDSPQQFCATDTTLTFADIVVYNTTGFSNINWYNANNTTGSPIDPTTPLVAGTYYAFQGEGSCAVGLEVVVEMVTDIPAQRATVRNSSVLPIPP